MEKFIEIAKKIIECNTKPIGISGTLMLKLRGIDLGREIGDLDLIIDDYSENVKLPKDLILKELEKTSDGTNSRYECDGIKIDILSSNEKIEMVGGLPLGSVDSLMAAKYVYYQKNDKTSEKHYKDLIKLGFVFPTDVSKTTDSECDLSFLGL